MPPTDEPRTGSRVYRRAVTQLAHSRCPDGFVPREVVDELSYEVPKMPPNGTTRSRHSVWSTGWSAPRGHCSSGPTPASEPCEHRRSGATPSSHHSTSDRSQIRNRPTRKTPVSRARRALGGVKSLLS